MLQTMTTTVVRARQPGITGYRATGRNTIFGNPYRLIEHGGTYTREESCRLYDALIRERFEADPEFRRAVLALHGQRLGCTCPEEFLNMEAEVPLCHAVVLARLVNEKACEAAARKYGVTARLRYRLLLVDGLTPHDALAQIKNRYSGQGEE